MDLVKGVSEGIVFVTGRRAESVEMHRVRVPEQSLASGERATFAVQTNRTRILPVITWHPVCIWFFEYTLFRMYRNLSMMGLLILDEQKSMVAPARTTIEQACADTASI